MSRAHRTAAALVVLLTAALLPPAPAGAEEATPAPYAAGKGQPELCVLPEHAPAPAATDAWPMTSPAISYVGQADHEAVTASELGAAHIGGRYSGMYVSRDGGSAWSRTQSGSYIGAIEFADREHGWAAGRGATVRITRDGGATWSDCAFDSEISLGIYDIKFVDPLHGWLVGKTAVPERPLIYRTTDGGVTWVAQNPADLSAGVLTSVDFIDRLRGFAVGPDVALSTTDGGATWSPMNLAGTDLQAILVIADGLLAVDFDGIVRHSADFGLTWTERTRVRYGAQALSLAGDAVFLAGMNGLLLASFDGGWTWVAEWTRTVHLRDVAAAGPRRAIAVGDNGVVVRVTTQPPAPPAANTTYFLTQSDEALTFTSERPQSTEDRVAVDLPGWNRTPEGAHDPTWHGAVDGTINRIDVDFWQRSGEDAIDDYGSYELVVWTGTGSDAQQLVRRFWRRTPLQAGPTRVTAIFDDLSIDPRGKPVAVSLRDLLPDGTSIVYGSVQHPSGFTINPPSTVPSCGAISGVVSQDSTTNDPCLASQWGLHQIDAPAAWQHKQATGRGVIAAVIDTGLDLAHPDFACPGKVLELDGADVVEDGGSVQDEHGHGTHVGGIIGACTDNAEGVAGVAPDVTLLPVQFLNEGGRGTSDDLARAIDVATDNGAHVINMSLGISPAVLGAAVVTLTPEIQAAIDRAAAAGVVLVAAAGNSDEPLCSYPAASSNIVCVSAVGPNRQQTWYTNFATKLDGTSAGPSLAAPGGTGENCQDDILSTWIRSAKAICSTSFGYEAIAGTSMAAPHVAGAAALLYERLGTRRSEQNARTIVHALTSTAQDLGEPGWDRVYGSGLLDADAAALAVEPVAPPLKSTTLTITDESATSGQYSDPARVEARLTEQNGTAVAGATVHLSIGTGAVASVATDVDGVVALDLPLVDEPGATRLRAHFAGTDTHGDSSVEVPFSVQHERTHLLLENDKKTMHALLYDDDGAAVPHRLVAFYAPDGRHVGSALTASDGMATLDVKCSGRCVSSAVFAPDSYYLGSRSG